MIVDHSMWVRGPIMVVSLLVALFSIVIGSDSNSWTLVIVASASLAIFGIVGPLYEWIRDR